MKYTYEENNLDRSNDFAATSRSVALSHILVFLNVRHVIVPITSLRPSMICFLMVVTDLNIPEVDIV